MKKTWFFVYLRVDLNQKVVRMTWTMVVGNFIRPTLYKNYYVAVYKHIHKKATNREIRDIKNYSLWLRPIFSYEVH